MTNFKTHPEGIKPALLFWLGLPAYYYVCWFASEFGKLMDKVASGMI